MINYSVCVLYTRILPTDGSNRRDILTQHCSPEKPHRNNGGLNINFTFNYLETMQMNIDNNQNKIVELFEIKIVLCDMRLPGRLMVVLIPKRRSQGPPTTTGGDYYCYPRPHPSEGVG